MAEIFLEGTCLECGLERKGGGGEGHGILGNKSYFSEIEKYDIIQPTICGEAEGVYSNVEFVQKNSSSKKLTLLSE